MQDLGGTSGSQLPVVPPKPAPGDGDTVDPYARLSFAPATPDQILRAYQRDGSHVQRLSELASELIRSAAAIDALTKAIYLVLTLGRSQPSLGEEYTDIAPHVRGRVRVSRMRRSLAIFLLVLPSLLTSSDLLANLRPRDDTGGPASAITKLQRYALQLLESPLGQSLPEISTIAFLFGGTFLEFGRRISGLAYITTASNRPIERPTYEPLSLLLALPLTYKILRWYHERLLRKRQRTGVFQQDLLVEQRPLPDEIPCPGILSDRPNTYLTVLARDQVERQCTLCLEPRGSGEGSGGTVAVTECGHAYCWGCLAGLDKAECPLCRQSLRMERLVATYNL